MQDEEEDPAGAEDDVIRAGRRPRAGGAASASRPAPVGDDRFDGSHFAHGAEPGDHGKSTNAHGQAIDLPFVADREDSRTKSAVVLAGGLQSAFERAKCSVSADGEDDPLQPAAGCQVAADLVDLDLGRLVEREAADARAEGDERQRAGAELVGLPASPRSRAG